MLVLHNNTEEICLRGGASRRIISHGKEMMAVDVSFETGAVGAVHTHPHVQISYVLDGKFKAAVGDDVRIISVGDAYLTVPDIPHGVVCLEKGRLLDFFTPEREDFLA